MAKSAGISTPAIGGRIRERRLEMGLRQGELARSVGISPSYLNLIEHDKRRIGGKLLRSIAEALDRDPMDLTRETEAALQDGLRAAAATVTPKGGALPEIDQIDAFARRFPGWTRTIADQHRRIAALEALADSLRDRLHNDPVLAEALHDVLSGVSAIRATAAILAEDAALDPQWRTRFHRNLHEEAERLSERSTALMHHFDPAVGPADRARTLPEDAVETLFDVNGHHFPAIEAKGELAIPDLLRGAGLPDDPAALDLARRALTAYAADAARLPLDRLMAAGEAADFAPDALYALAGGDVALVLRRMASLPPGAPEFGLAVCDASGALLRRRRIGGFAAPRFGDGCPLWPLYRALSRPLSPERGVMQMPDGAEFRFWAVSQPSGTAEPDGQPVMQSTMLIRDRGEASGAVAAAPVGPGCSLCSRADCAARRNAELPGD